MRGGSSAFSVSMRHGVEISLSARENSRIFSSSVALEPFRPVVMETAKDKYRDVKFATDLNRLALELLGLWPDMEHVKADKNAKLKCITSVLFLLGFMYLPQSTLLVMSFGDLNLVTQILATGDIIVFCALIKIIMLRLKREDLGRLLKHINEDWTDYANEEIREIMLKNVTFVRKLCISYSITPYIAMLLYIIVKILFYFTKNPDDDTYPGLELFVPSYLPKYFSKSPSFEFMFAGQIVTTLIAINAYAGCDSLLVMLIMHVCTQFAILRSSLKNLTVIGYAKNSTKFMRELGAIVRRHEHLNRFASMIDNSFNMILLLQMILCSLLLCFQCFQFVVKLKVKDVDLSITEFVFFIFFICPILIQLYMYCYLGERLQYEIEEIRRTAYECLWYIWDPKDARTMIIIMARTIHPVQLTAGKFSPFTMSTFADILKTSMSYLSVILATIDD